jgi:hypothetical protein
MIYIKCVVISVLYLYTIIYFFRMNVELCWTAFISKDRSFQSRVSSLL